jgi:CPA1 family monovalent cation:H+ antiporter
MSPTAEHIRLIVLLLLIALGVALLARRAKLPYTLGLVVVGLGIGIFHLLPGVVLTPDLVLVIFLPALLFEGAWNMEQRELVRNWFPIFLLAGPGMAITIVIASLILHFAVGLDWAVAFLLGAIISPTDPIAVLALLRQIGMSSRLRILIEGESLFNDGVAAAVTLALETIIMGSAALALASHAGFAAETSASQAGTSGGMIALNLFLGLLRLVGGGIGMGLAVGFLVSRLVRYVNDRLIETTLTMVVAYGVYLLADAVQVSGILAVITAALILGSYGRKTGMNPETQNAVDGFWDFAAYVANSLLFLLVGIQLGQIPLTGALAAIGWGVLSVIAGRALMVYLNVYLHNTFLFLVRHSRRRKYLSPGFIPRRWRILLLSSGLRGALSLALALALPLETPSRNTLIVIVYGVVLVTLLGQGFGLRLLVPLLRRERRRQPAKQPESPAEEVSLQE